MRKATNSYFISMSRTTSPLKHILLEINFTSNWAWTRNVEHRDYMLSATLNPSVKEVPGTWETEAGVVLFDFSTTYTWYITYTKGQVDWSVSQ